MGRRVSVVYASDRHYITMRGGLDDRAPAALRVKQTHTEGEDDTLEPHVFTISITRSERSTTRKQSPLKNPAHV